jgi:hypothetical protein
LSGEGSLAFDSSERKADQSLACPILTHTTRGKLKKGLGRKSSPVPAADPFFGSRSDTKVSRHNHQVPPFDQPDAESATMSSEKIKIAIDRGGTFTDCIGSYKGKEEIVKLLSVDPNNYDDAPLEGIRRLLEKFTGKKIAREDKLDTSLIGIITSC